MKNLIYLQPDDSLLLTNRDDLLGDIEQYTDANNALFAQWQSSRSTAADAIIAANAAITTTGIPDGNEKLLNDLYLKKAAKNQWTMDATDMTLLEGIAYQCPEQGGPAVYWARSWYAAMTNTPINPFDCIRGRSGKSLNDIQSETAYFIYPNPSSGLLTLQYPESYTDRQMDVFNMTGRLVEQITIRQGATKQQVDLQGLNNGIYLLRAMKAGKTVLSQRVSIIH